MPFKKTAVKGQQQPVDAKNIFIGRTHELHFYIQHILHPEDPTHNILSISGQGGVGKSTLINRFIAEAHATNFKDYCLTALVNERQPTPASIMEHFADQFREAGQPLKKFDEALTHYKEALRRMQAGSRDEQEILLREGVDLVGELAEDIPFAGKALHRGAGTVTELLLDKHRTRQYLKDAAQLEDPIGDLTQAFIKDLNQIADTQVSAGTQSNKRQRRILLFFDTFEQLASDAAPWLLDHLLETDISTNIVLIIAGRDSIENTTPHDPKRWLPYLDNENIHLISLDSFTEGETHAYLKERGITDTAQIAQIWQLSRGLPLYLGLLTANPQGKVDPNANVVANFLRWIPEQEVLKRRLALDAALFSMPFNQDDLTAFDYTEQQCANFFEWLISQPFVRTSGNEGRYMYHELAQELFSRHLYQRSSDEYYTTREALIRFYQRRIERIEKDSKEDCYHSTSWQDVTLALAQQLFLLGGEEYHLKGIEWVIKAYEHVEKKEKVIKVLHDIAQEQPGNQTSIGAQKIAKELLIYCNSDTTHRENVQAVSFLLDKSRYITAFSAEVQGYLYRMRARSYRGLKQYQEALSDFNNALTLLPNYKKAFAGRGRTHFLLEDYQQAINDLNRAIELSPHNPWDFIYRGRAYQNLKEHQQAIDNYTYVLQLNFQSLPAYSNRGLAYCHLKDYQRAIDDFTNAINLNANIASLYRCRGDSYHYLKDYQQAIDDYTRTVKIDPAYTWAYINRGTTYFLLKDFQRAIDDYTQASKIDSMNITAYRNRGLVYHDLKAYKQAIQDFTRAIELDPQYANVYANRGWTYYQLKDYQKALADLDKVIALQPDNANAYNSLGRIYRALKSYEQAIVDFSRAVELDPHFSRPYNNRGLVYQDLKDYPQAILDLNKAIELDANYATAHANRGKIYSDLHNYQQALQDFTRAIELDPTSWMHLQRGYCYLHTKQIEQAKADFARCWQLDPTNTNYGWMVEFADMCQQHPDQKMPERLDAIAQANLQSDTAYICQAVAQWLCKNSEQALAKIEQALTINPTSDDAHFWKGMILATLDQYEEAITSIEKSLELGLPPILLSPLCWFEQDCPDFYTTYAVPLLARYS